MKKALMLLTAAVVLTMSAVCVSASTTLEDYIPVKDKYTITYDVGETNAAGMYGMVAIKGTNTIIDTSNLNNIYYIDQASANSDGIISFTEFAPKGVAPSNPNYEESTVFIGGPGFGSAEAIGYLRKGELEFFISGKVIDTNETSTVASVTVLSDTSDIYSSEVDNNGEYSIPIPAGDNYSVSFTKPGYCSYTYTGVSIEDSVNLGSLNITNRIGDVDDKGQVNSYDIIGVVTDFGKTSAFNYKYSDLNGDGRVNSYDLLAVIKGFGSANKTEPYSASN